MNKTRAERNAEKATKAKKDEAERKKAARADILAFFGEDCEEHGDVTSHNAAFGACKGALNVEYLHWREFYAWVEDYDENIIANGSGSTPKEAFKNAFDKTDKMLREAREALAALPGGKTI